MAYWNTAREERAKQLWLSGYSGGEIASLLGGGITRNAVLGKLMRLGLKGKGARRATGGKVSGQASDSQRACRKRRAARLPKKVRAEQQVVLSGEPKKIFPEIDTTTPSIQSVLELSSVTCKWPIGDPRDKDFGFCGKPVIKGRRAYCEYHTQRCKDARAPSKFIKKAYAA